ncbi:MAG: hypothetical protein MN733_14175 [Nitrososphaera sp.]|nr:hypothetical protein [Nitrososphaera sp.]
MASSPSTALDAAGLREPLNGSIFDRTFPVRLVGMVKRGLTASILGSSSGIVFAAFSVDKIFPNHPRSNKYWIDINLELIKIHGLVREAHYCFSVANPEEAMKWYNLFSSVFGDAGRINFFGYGSNHDNQGADSCKASGS